MKHINTKIRWLKSLPFAVTAFDLELHEDHFNQDFDDGTLKRQLSIEERFQQGSDQLNVGNDTLKRCSFKLEVNEKAIYNLSQEEAIDLIKSFEADPELRRYYLLNYKRLTKFQNRISVIEFFYTLTN